MSWFTAFDVLSLEQYFALNIIFFLLPSIVILISGKSHVVQSTSSLSKFFFTSLFIIWFVPILLAIASEFVWVELTVNELLFERAILTLSLCLIGWAYLQEDQNHNNRRSLALLLILSSAIIVIWIYTTRRWSLDILNVSNLTNSVNHLIWLLLLTGISVLSLVYCFIRFSKIPFVIFKVYFFAVLAFTFIAASFYNLNAINFQVESNYSYRLGWLLAMIALPILMSRQRMSWQETTRYPDFFSGGMGSLTAEWAALQALSNSLAQKDSEGIKQTLLHAATQLTSSRIGMLLHIPQWKEEEEIHFVEVVEYFDVNQVRNSLLIALSLTDLPKISSSIIQKETIVLKPEIDTSELKQLFRQLDMSRNGLALMIPLERSNHALLLVTSLIEDVYTENIHKVMRYFAQYADDILYNLFRETQNTLAITDLPDRDTALRNAREHILQLTAELAIVNKKEVSASLVPQPNKEELENAPLAWQVLMEDKQRENARLKIEREVLTERLKEWEELLTVWGVEGGPLGLWQHLADEKDRVTHTKVEIEYLKQELEQFRQQVIDRPVNVDEPNQPVSQSEAHTPRKELPDNTFDLLSTVEKSLIPVAAQIREKSIQVEMETMPNLPRIYGEGILLRGAIESIFELLIVSAPRNSKLHISTEPIEGEVHLQFSIQGMKLRFDEFLQEAQEKIQAIGGSMRKLVQDASDDQDPEDVLDITLPIKKTDESISVAS